MYLGGVFSESVVDSLVIDDGCECSCWQKESGG